MAEAKIGDRVSVHYAGRLEDGTEFDSSAGREPLDIVLGDNMVIPGFESGVIGMTVGEKRTITITADEAYGQISQELIVTVPRERLPEDLDPELGQHLQMHRADGGHIDVLVTDVNEQSITIDANHPLAGKALVFDIHLVAIG
jgi:peptidylprolyl isomerase